MSIRPNPCRQPQPHHQSAEILALLERDAAAIDFRDVAHDRQAQSRTGFATVEPDSPVDNAAAVGGGDAGAIVLDQYFCHPAVALDGDEDAAAAIFRCIFEQIADQFVEILAFDTRDQRLVARCVEPRFRVKQGHRARHAVDALAHIRARLRGAAAPDGTRTREVMLDLPLHRRSLAPHRVGEFGAVTGRAVDEHGERGLERMREVAGMQPRFFGLFLVMREQRVEFVDHRLHLERQRGGDAALLSAAHRGDRAADMAQRPQAVEGLKRREDDQPEPEQSEAGDQRRAQRPRLHLQHVARLGDLEPPFRLAARQHHIALGDAQFLVGELVAVIDMENLVVVRVGRVEPPFPQRARGIGFLPPAADLPVKAAVRFEEARVAERLDHPDLAVGTDFGRADHAEQHIFEVRDRSCA